MARNILVYTRSFLHELEWKYHMWLILLNRVLRFSHIVCKHVKYVKHGYTLTLIILITLIALTVTLTVTKKKNTKGNFTDTQKSKN